MPSAGTADLVVHSIHPIFTDQHVGRVNTNRQSSCSPWPSLLFCGVWPTNYIFILEKELLSWLFAYVYNRCVYKYIRCATVTRVHITDDILEEEHP